MSDPSFSKPSNLAGDLKTLAGALKIRRTKLLPYVFAATFVATIAFLAFNPSPTTSSPWFSNVFASSAVPYRSQIANLFSFVFPNSTELNSPQNGKGSVETAPKSDIGVKNGMGSVEIVSKSDIGVKNESGSGVGASKSDLEAKNGTGSVETASKSDIGGRNESGSGVGALKNDFGAKNGTGNGNDGILMKDQGSVSLGKNGTKSSVGSGKSGGELSSAGAKNETSSGNQASVKNETKSSDGELAAAGAKNGSEKGGGSNSSGNQASGKKDNGVGGKNESSYGNSAASKGGETGKIEKKGNSAVSNSGETGKTEQKGDSVVPGSGETGKIEKKGDSAVLKSGVTGKIEKKVDSGKGKVSNLTISSSKQKGSVSSPAVARTIEDWISGMKGCDLFDGRWVKDEAYPLYPEGSCPLIDEPFNCYLNGRPDLDYQKLRWKPKGCEIPRLNPIDMLERLRGKRLVFVGDSLNRNMWESMVCILRNAVKDKKKVFEASGRSEFRTVGSYSFIFKDYNCSVEYYRSPFLVQEWEMSVNKGSTKETLRLDIIEKSSPKYKNADVIVFNTGHWWTHEKTSKGKDYYQEGNKVYHDLNVLDAFHKALNTWAKWVDSNVNPKKTLVFFRGYSASHFSGGQWNSGGQCDKETEPITNDKYLTPYPSKMTVLESVIKGMKTPVSYMNITRMTDYRKDGHPSIFRKMKLTDEERKAPERYQDCSHWCMPGVPDSWNELLYAELLIKQHQTISGQ